VCNPIAIVGAVSVAASIAGSVMSAKGAADKAESDQKYYNHLADVAEANVGEVRQAGAFERQSITENVSRETQSNKVQTAQLMGKQNVAAAATGAGMGSVTSADIARDTINKSTLDEMYIRYQADTQKYLSAKKENKDVENLLEQARGYRAGGEAAKTAGGYQVAGTLLSGASQVASNLYNYKKG
jgi:hypothetical protein